jgi:membrane protein implicated in regulation of membrane protease activity
LQTAGAGLLLAVTEWVTALTDRKLMLWSWKMKALVAAALAILAFSVLPAMAQTTSTQPSNGQNSGTGIAGQPGGKNGPAAKSHANDQTNPTTREQDSSKVQGKPGSKSGPAVTPPPRR